MVIHTFKRVKFTPQFTPYKYIYILNTYLLYHLLCIFLQQCQHKWTSMKGRVIFWIHLNHKEKLGAVLFKLYGQACNRCHTRGQIEFIPPMWYIDEVIKVQLLMLIYQRTLLFIYIYIYNNP